MKRTISIIAALLALAGCKGTGSLLPNVSGKAGEVIVVIDKTDWEGSLGNATRELLACDCPYLAQQEPLYTLANVNPSGFGDLFKVHRNIVFYNLNPQLDTIAVSYQKDVWATPQIVIQVSAPDADGAIRALQQNGETIISAIEQAERDRVIANSIRYEEKSIAPQVADIFGGSPHFPTGYKLKKKTDDFVWIADEKQYTMQGIFIYRYSVLDNEPFSEKSIISHRNEVLKANVPGMFDNTWMTTSDFFPAKINFSRYRGRQFAETRGMWEVQNDYMGGPFVSHSFYSQDGFDIIVAEAFVYAPKYDKRQYLRQVESILYSWEWWDKVEK